MGDEMDHKWRTIKNHDGKRWYYGKHGRKQGHKLSRYYLNEAQARAAQLIKYREKQEIENALSPKLDLYEEGNAS